MENKPIEFQGLTFKGNLVKDDFKTKVMDCSDPDQCASWQFQEGVLISKDHGKSVLALLESHESLLEAAISMYNKLHTTQSFILYQVCQNREESDEGATKALAPFAETIKKSFI